MPKSSEVRVPPASLDAALIQGYTSQPSVGGLRLRFEREVLVVASLADQWVLSTGSIPAELGSYLRAGSWLGGTSAEQPSPRSVADLGGRQEQVDEDQDRNDQ